jgi:catalase
MPRKPRSRSTAKPSPAQAKAAATQTVVAAFPSNRHKPAEFGTGKAPAGQHLRVPDPVGASTAAEGNTNPKTESLDGARVDDAGQGLTTNLGVPVADNQSSLKAGLRGPTLMEDFILREKITHFDHERIPERIVHARGSAAHGYFECLAPQTKLTKADFLSAKGKRTPVFVRFSTVAGERGSTDLARDIRGFAVKFYTDEGNYDLVGNNIPVFFIQDAMKFPDLVHAVKPEPHNGMPQAASAHDTFWDFVSLMPESTHVLMWVMSDRGIPRSYRMMQGFGVHTFRLVNQAGESRFVKFHWNPKAGTHSVDWDEAVKISGADSDFHRRDLWDAIEAGAYPEWELGLQVFSEAQAEKFSFDVLDPTKIVPEELVPVVPVGRMILNRNPDNFFAETEQVAFGAGHVVPGIDFSNDPLLAGRIHSYVDTQISRLGGANFHEIPINAPVAPLHNNQRDGIHRQTINRGRVAYEPNSLGGGCPFQHGSAAGFTSFPDPSPEDKVRGKGEKFADHYTQATLFWNSQTPVEQAHIVRAFRFELTKVQVPAIRKRVLAQLANVDKSLATSVANGLGMAVPPPLPLAGRAAKAELTRSAPLSLTARPGDGGIATRKIAILIADGVDGDGAREIHRSLGTQGAVPQYVAARLGTVKSSVGAGLEPDGTLETMPSCTFDAVAIPDGAGAAAALSKLGHGLEFVKDQFRHCKAILAVGAGRSLLEKAGLPLTGEDAALVLVPGSNRRALGAFVTAIAKHRNWDRATDPPLV